MTIWSVFPNLVTYYIDNYVLVCSRAGLKDRQTRQRPRAPKLERGLKVISYQSNVLLLVSIEIRSYVCVFSMQLNYMYISYFISFSNNHPLLNGHYVVYHLN